MNYWENIFSVMSHQHQYVTLSSEEDKVIVYEKGELVYVFNFHPNKSYEDYLIGTNWRSDHMILFETDELRFGGHERLNDAHNKWFRVGEMQQHERHYSMKLYIPSRCAIVLAPFEFAQKYEEVPLPIFDEKDDMFKRFMIKKDDNLAQAKIEPA